MRMDKDEREWMMRFCDFQAFLAVDKSPEAFPRTAPAIVASPFGRTHVPTIPHLLGLC